MCVDGRRHMHPKTKGHVRATGGTPESGQLEARADDGGISTDVEQVRTVSWHRRGTDIHGDSDEEIGTYHGRLSVPQERDKSRTKPQVEAAHEGRVREMRAWRNDIVVTVCRGIKIFRNRRKR